MKKYPTYILLISCIITLFSCQQQHDVDLSKTDFIYIKNNSFYHKEQSFFPLMLNYVVSYQSEGNQFMLAPHVDYDSLGIAEAQNGKTIDRQLLGHFQLIKEMGFNTLRICFDRVCKDEKQHYYYDAERRFYLNNEQDVLAIIDGLDHFTNLAAQKGLRIMLLIKPPIDNPELEQFTIKILQKMRDNSTIFAYDFMNEPLYFDDCPNRTKEEAFKIVSHWKSMMVKNAPNQLFTIGFSEPIEVFEWDASILPVDFVQIHTYHPLRVPCEIYWYSQYIHKPWMIGETGLPADNDSISYTEQQHFMQEVYQLTRDAGGCGLGWWEFQEISNTHFEAQYTGLLNHEGKTFTKEGNYCIYGSIKPAATALQHYEYHPQKPIKRPVNYFNMMGYNNICIHGKIQDARTRQPIAGAVIRGWNENWSVGMNTFSDENGSFTLYCNDFCTHYEISAPGKSKMKFDKTIDYQKNSNATGNINSLPNQNLEYHSISYHPFLVYQNPLDSNYRIFNFNSSHFSRYKLTGDIGIVLLEDIHN